MPPKRKGNPPRRAPAARAAADEDTGPAREPSATQPQPTTASASAQPLAQPPPALRRPPRTAAGSARPAAPSTSRAAPANDGDSSSSDETVRSQDILADMQESDTPAPSPSPAPPAAPPTSRPITGSIDWSSFGNRPTENCVADSRYFASSKVPYYQFMVITQLSSDSSGKLESCTIQCAICHQNSENSAIYHLSPGSMGSTPNYKRHFETHHPQWWNPIATALNQAEAGKNAAPGQVETFTLELFYEKLVRWVIMTNQPFTAVEDEEFRDLLSLLKPDIRGDLIGADAIRERVIRFAQNSRGRLAQLLEPIKRIPLSVDAWTSPNNIAFLAIVFTFVSEKWELHEAILDFRALKGSHSGENMANVVFESMKELGILGKFISVTADNASNNSTLVASLTNSLRDMASVGGLDAQQSTVRCLPHVIHLAVVDFLVASGIMNKSEAKTSVPDFTTYSEEELETMTARETGEEGSGDAGVETSPEGGQHATTVVRRLRKFVRAIRSSPQRIAHFHQVAAEVNQRRTEARNPDLLSTVKLLILDVVTRWNSLFLMLERAYEFREVLNILAKDSSYTAYKISTTEWEMIHTLIERLKYFHKCTENMSSNTFPTLGSSLATYISLLNRLDKWETESRTQGAQNMVRGIIACRMKLEKYLEKSGLETYLYYYGTFFDTRFGHRFFTSVKRAHFFDQNWVTNCFERLRDEYLDHFASLPTSPPSPSKHRTSRTTNFALDDSGIWSDEDESPASSSTETALQELQRFMLERWKEREGNPLEWWRQNEVRFPTVARMARIYLSIPGSSVSVERALSSGRDTISLRRASLLPSTIRALMTTRSLLLLERKMK